MATPKKSPRIEVEEVNKRIVVLNDGVEQMRLVYDSSTGKVLVALDGYTEYEDEMTAYSRDNFLDAVVAMFPDNVAYQFDIEEE